MPVLAGALLAAALLVAALAVLGVVLTGRAALAALIGVAVVALAPGVVSVLVVNGALAALVAVDVALAGSVRAVEVRRDATSGTRARLGEPVEVALLVTNTSGRPLRGWLRDAWPPSAGAATPVHRLDLPPGQRRRLVTVLLPERRGERRPDRVTLRRIGPVRLAGRQGRHDAPWAVRVLPPFSSRRHLPERLARLRRITGSNPALVRGQGSEFDSLRDYVLGDDVRSIDWRASARRDSVVVRTWRPERDRRVVLVIDTGRTSAGRVGGETRLDVALDAALLLGALAGRAGDRVDLIAVDRLPRVAVDNVTRREVLPALVEAMTPLEPALVEADGRALVAEVLRRTRGRALVVLFTELNAAALEQALLPVLPSLTARHLVVLAAVADPRVAELATGRGDATAVYAAGAAERERLERRRLTGLLRRRGVEVVDASPAELAPAVADAYLAFKAAGRL